MIGVSVLTRHPGSFSYSSSGGYFVTVTGTGFAFDSEGIATAGTLDRITATLGGTLLSDFTDLNYSLVTRITQTFGTVSGSTTTVPPDPDALFSGLRQGDDLIEGNALGKDIDGYAGNDTIHTGGGDD